MRHILAFSKGYRTTLSFLLLAKLILVPGLVLGADAKASDQTINYIGAAQLKLLLKDKMPEDYTRLELSASQQEFQSRLSSNVEFISDAAILLIEALTLNSDAAAAKLLSRYDPDPLPDPLREFLVMDDARRLSHMADAQIASAHKTKIRLHPFWWSTPGCEVAIDGQRASAQSEKLLLEGNTFYVQRICLDPVHNRLARGSVPLGRDMIFVAFRGDPTIAEKPEPDINTPQISSSKHWTYGFSVQASYGRFGLAPVLLGERNRPEILYGFSLGTPNCWSIDLTAGQLIGKTSSQTLKRNLLVHGGLNKCAHFRHGALTLEPFFGGGLVAVSPGNGLLTRAAFLAPLISGGLASYWDMGPLPLRIGAQLALRGTSPPWKGHMAQFGLVLQLIESSE